MACFIFANDSPSTPNSVQKKFSEKLLDGSDITYQEVREAIDGNNLSFKKQPEHVTVKQKDRVRFCQNLQRMIEKGLCLFCHVSEKDTIKILVSFISQIERISKNSLIRYESDANKINIILFRGEKNESNIKIKSLKESIEGWLEKANVVSIQSREDAKAIKFLGYKQPESRKELNQLGKS